MLRRYFAAIAAAVALTTSANAQQWGDIEADFLLKGSFTPEKIVPDKDQAVCGKHQLYRENVVVDPQTKAIKNIAIYLLPTLGKKVPVHADYAKTATDKVTLDNKNCQFVPHILTVRTTQTLELTNSDPVGHNSKAEFFNNTPFNVLIPSQGKATQKLGSPETSFMKVECSIHPWMNAYLLVKEDPYVAFSDAKGHLVMKNVPAGEWTFVVWQENAGYLSDVIVNGKPTKWARGRIKMTVKPGVNNLGKIEVEPAALKIK